MKGFKISPYILASILLMLLFSMMQMTRQSLSKPVHAQEQSQERKDYFYLPVGSANVSNVSEQDYRELITDFQSHYQSAVIQTTGMPLLIPNEWNSPYFTAFAIKRDTYMQVSLWGGMARAPGFTKLQLAAALCHEIGHVIAGEPRQTIPGSDWASTEGNSDFYAARVCLPDYLRRHPELAKTLVINARIQHMCGANESCQQVAQIGFDLVNSFQRYSYREFTPVSLDVRAAAVTELVRNSYPTDQCRLDTFLAGASCQLGQQCHAPTCWLPAQQ
ncbi:hypothetical protein DOE51_16640 [Bdellovibrio sp. NC01]|nr:hypothetical protein DOE51_16640 [Bdellovibrio sp. NC01]